MTAYSMTAEQYGAVAVGSAWATSASQPNSASLAAGTTNAEQFVNQTFGAASPRATWKTPSTWAAWARCLATNLLTSPKRNPPTSSTDRLA